jgi:hypothetical protein
MRAADAEVRTTSFARGVLPLAMVAVLAPSAIAGLSPARAQAPSCDPARVAGLSYVLDAFATGAGVAPGVAYGVAQAVLGSPLPGPLGAAQQQILNAGASAVRTMSTEGPAQINGLRADVELLAVYNDYADAFMEMGADRADAFADQFAETVQPFDVTIHEFATMVRTAEEHPQPCGASTGVRARTGVTRSGQVGLAFALGDGKRAAALIKRFGLTGSSDGLGQAVYLGGIAAVATKRFDSFRTAVAYALPHSGTPIQVATQAFRGAATKAATNGLTATMAAVGGRTVMETYQAYATGGA